MRALRKKTPNEEATARNSASRARLPSAETGALKFQALLVGLWITLATQALGNDFAPPQEQALEDDFPAAEYAARAVREGMPTLWNGAELLGEDKQVFRPPPWYLADFPTEPLIGILVDRHGDTGAIARIVHRPEAEQGWERLRLLIFDLPQAEGNFDARQKRLDALLANAGSPRLEAASWGQFPDSAALRAALEEMYRTGGDGYVLRLKESEYDDSQGHLLMRPYQIGTAKVVSHRPGSGDNIGMMGSLEVADAHGGEFIVGSGFTHRVRRDPPVIGSYIRFKYKGYTATGKPRNPVFLGIAPTVVTTAKIGGFLQTSHLSWFFLLVMLSLTTADGLSFHRRGAHLDFKSAIVSSGLMGTFIGIWWGLYNFDTSDIIGGVPNLLEGLKFAFVTSIIGIALSTLLSIWQTSYGARPPRAAASPLPAAEPVSGASDGD